MGTKHHPSGEEVAIYDAAARYIQDGTPTIIIAGKEYGSGSSRDWAAKGPYLQGVKAVIAESATTHGFTGEEAFSFDLSAGISVNQTVSVTTNTGKSFQVKSRLDTDPEVAYFMNGGILRYVLRKLV